MTNGYDLGFRFDLLGLSSEWSEGIPKVMEDGTPVIDGSTAYEVDTGKFYIFYKDNWYEQGVEEEISSNVSDASDNDSRNLTKETEIIIEEPKENEEVKNEK